MKICPTNCHLYHYAGNNPITYTDPNGKSDIDFQFWSFLAQYTSGQDHFFCKLMQLNFMPKDFNNIDSIIQKLSKIEYASGQYENVVIKELTFYITVIEIMTVKIKELLKEKSGNYQEPVLCFCFFLAIKL